MPISYKLPDTYVHSKTELPAGWRFLQVGETRYANRDLKWAGYADRWIPCSYTEKLRLCAGEYITPRPLPEKLLPFPAEFITNRDAVPPGFRYREVGERTESGVDFVFSDVKRQWVRAPWAERVRFPEYSLTRAKPRSGSAPHRYSGGVRAPSTLARGENNDCAVVALAHAGNMSYDDAHAFWELHGRKRGRGTYTGRVMPYGAFEEKVFAEAGFKATKVGGGGGLKAFDYSSGSCKPVYADGWFRGTLRSFCRRFPTGRFFVSVSSHALAVVDGVIVDHTSNDLRRIRNAYRIEPVNT